MNRILPLVFASALVLFAAAAVFAPRLVTASLFGTIGMPLAMSAPSQPVEGIVVGPPLTDQTESAVDLYGNDISPAVAQYAIDPLGSQYEMHSPQTELPRLPSPKS